MAFCAHDKHLIAGKWVVGSGCFNSNPSWALAYNFDALATRRSLRSVCCQNVPAALLPEDLR